MSLEHGFDIAQPAPAMRPPMEKTAMTKTPKLRRPHKVAQLPPAPQAPAANTADAALAYMLACHRYLEEEIHTEVHGEDAIDRVCDTVYAPSRQAMIDAPCRDLNDVSAKLAALEHWAIRDGGDVHGAIEPILAQILPVVRVLAVSHQATELWQASVAAYESACAEEQRCADEEEALGEQIESDPAKPRYPEHLKGPRGEWMTSDDIDQMTELPPAVHATMKAELDAFWTASRDHAARFGLHAASDACLAAARHVGPAREALMNIPAPTPQAALYKLCLVGLRLGVDMNDPEDVQTVLTNQAFSEDDARRAELVATYRDMARLAGAPDPWADVQAWDVEAFGRQFLTVYSGEWSNSGSPAFIGNIPDDDPAYAVWKSLTDWQKTAMRNWLKQQPRAEMAANLQRRVRADACDWIDPGVLINTHAQLLGCGAAEVRVVVEGVADLFAAHASYQETVVAWVDRYLAAGGSFALDGNLFTVPPAAVLIGRTPENEEAGKLERELMGELRSQVGDEVRRRMGERRVTYLSGTGAQ